MVAQVPGEIVGPDILALVDQGVERRVVVHGAAVWVAGWALKNLQEKVAQLWQEGPVYRIEVRQVDRPVDYAPGWQVGVSFKRVAKVGDVPFHALQ
ncbi:hypothetical protein D3C77_483060 [compost metagenome]